MRRSDFGGGAVIAAGEDKVYRRVLTIYMAFVALVTIAIGLLNVRRHDDWAMADWLINYSGGFVRRGFTGEIASWLTRWHVSPFAFVLVLQLALYGLIFYAVLRLSENIVWNLWTIALVYSPATLAFPLNDPSFAYRKEILFFALLGGTLLLLWNRKWRDLWLSLLLALSAAVCILSHEALLVFFPYLLCALLIGFRDVGRAVRVGAMPAIVAVVSFVIVSRFPGNLAVSRTVCASLGSTLTYPPTGFCGGAIAYLSHDPVYAHVQVLRQMHTGIFAAHFAVIAMLSVLPIAVLIARLWRRPEQRFAAVCLTVCSAMSIAASVPLFVYGTDWTRWIYIHVFSLFLLLLFAMREESVEERIGHKVWPANAMVRYTTVVLLALYLFGWNLSTYQPRIPFGGLVHYVMHLRWNGPAV